jgi:alpha-ketoglutarate-dependent taurine dioxygenase
MSRFLQEIITDENLVWDKSLGNKPENFIVRLTSKTIDELKRNRKELKNLDKSNLPELKNEINELKITKILHGVGLVIIDGKCFTDFSDEEVIEIYRNICKTLGTLLTQNIKNEELVKVQYEKKSMQHGGRYHQSKEGGSFHTDSPHWEQVPDFVGLYCINPAKKGGESKFVSVYSVHNKMLKEHKHFLEMLYEQFHFDKRRGEYEPDKPLTSVKPIFAYNGNQLKCRYIRDYLNDGHKIQNIPLSKEQIEALDIFDKIIHDENLAITYGLQQNDMVFFNNDRVMHGRTSFEDFEDEEKKRLMIRTWIKFSS